MSPDEIEAARVLSDAAYREDSIAGLEAHYQKLRALVPQLLEALDIAQRRCNWFEAAHAAGKSKLIEKAEHDTAETIAAWLGEPRWVEFGLDVRGVAEMIASAIRTGAWRK